jgi:hypothetical protein
MNGTEAQSYQEFESLQARVVGVIRHPRVLFKSVIERPRWAAAMLLTFAVTAACGTGFMQTEVGRQALVDQWERTAQAFGQEVSDARYAEFTQMSEHGTFWALASALATGPVLTFLVAGLVVAVFGSGATFTQVLAVAAHAGVILALRQLVATPLNYARETLASPTTLGWFFPMLDEASPAARFFGAIDLFVVWWVIVLAVGVALAYRRPARSTTAVFVSTYVGLAVVLAIAMAVTGGAR